MGWARKWLLPLVKQPGWGNSERRRFRQVACKARFLLVSRKKEFPAGNPEQCLEKRSGLALFSEDRRSATKAQIPGTMRGPWLFFLFVGVTLVVAAISEAELPATEGGLTSEDASEKEEAHAERRQGARVAKAWWKKWIQENRKEAPPTPRPGVFGPLRDVTKPVHRNTTAMPGN